jgi:putative ABC transport system permease protein
MSRFLQDLRVAARTLRKQPGLTLAAVLTLGLGIGVNSAIFSVVDSALLTPPPFRAPDRLVVVWASNPPLAREMGFPDTLAPSNANLEDFQKQSRSFAHLAMMQPDRMRLLATGDPDLLGVTRVSGDFFAVLGTGAARGRTLVPADDVLDKPRAMVLSHRFWTRRFGADPRIVGAKVSLDGQPVTVVGVMPPRFAFPRGSEFPAGYGFDPQPDAWVPWALSAAQRHDRQVRFGVVIGRLRPGVAAATAQAELRTICSRLAQAYPVTDKGWSARLVPLTEQLVGDLRPALLALSAAVGLVLLIACANVANLLLARAASRQKEIAMRAAIGAGRGRLVAQLLTESVLLALLGGVLGVVLAWAALRSFAGAIPQGLAGAASFTIDGRVLAFTLALCLLTSLLAGLAPALQTIRPNLAGSLREGTRGGSASLGGRRTQSALVTGEVALAVLLLIGAGLLLRSFVGLLAIDPGFRKSHLLTFEIDLPQDQYAPAARVRFFERAVDRLRAIPGVAAAGSVDELPLTGFEGMGAVDLEGRPPVRPGEPPLVVDWHTAFPGYPEVLGVPLVRGRLLERTDTASSQQVALIDQGMARSFWPGQDPVGRRFRRANNDGSKGPWISVVGIVGTVRHSSLNGTPRPQLYQPAAQTPPDLMPYMVQFALRSAGGNPAALTAGARAAVRELDRNQPIADVRTMEQVVDTSVARQRFSLLLLGLFALLALVLSVVGIYGITSFSVVQRTRELGLRMALGAQRRGVLRLVLKDAGTLAGLGVALGLGAAFAVTRLLASFLYGVGAADPLTYAAVAAGLFVIALLAAYLPGRRATRVDPLVALRSE